MPVSNWSGFINVMIFQCLNAKNIKANVKKGTVCYYHEKMVNASILS